MQNSPAPAPEDPMQARAARRALLAAKLDAALVAASQLRNVAGNAFPAATAEVENLLMPALESLGAEAKMALGDEAASQLFQLSMALAPEATLDRMDAQLGKDVQSRNSAASAIAAAQRP